MQATQWRIAVALDGDGDGDGGKASAPHRRPGLTLLGPAPSTQKSEETGTRGGAGSRLADPKNLLDQVLPRDAVPTGLLGRALRDGNGLADPQELNVFSWADLLIALDLL